MIKRRPPRRPPLRHSLFKTKFRRLSHETLERRELLAAEVLAIRPDSAGLLQDGNVLNVAPRELNVFFNGGANLDESTINTNTVRLIRSGGDGIFGDGNDVNVALGYVGLVNPGSTAPAELQQIVLRPASSAAHNTTAPAVAFPDDFYQIQIIGAGGSPLADRGGVPFANGQNFVTNFRLDRGAQVVAVVPQPVTRGLGGALSQADDQIVVYFDNQLLNLGDAEDPKFFRLVDTRATLDAGDDQTLLPQTAEYDSGSNRVTLTFAEAIPEGTYRLDVGLSDGGNQTTGTAIRVGTLFNQNRFSYNGYLGDINGSNDDASDLDYYRFELTAGANLQLDIAPHDAQLDLTMRLRDQSGNVLASAASGPGTPATLNVPITATGGYFLEVSSTDGGTGSYRIEASVSGISVSTSDNNSTFTTATNLGSLGAAGLTLAAQIQPQNIPLPPWPAGTDEPGHRDIQRETHIPLRGYPAVLEPAAGMAPRLPTAVRQIHYRFPPAFPNQTMPGESFLNQITAEERRIVRALLKVIASHSGYEFIESAIPTAGELVIAKTDPRAFLPSDPGSIGLGGFGLAMVNAAVFSDSNRFYGDQFTRVMLHEIGHALGLSHSFDVPSIQGSGVANDVLPGDHDIVHLQRIMPANSTDIDMYRFELAEAGRFTAETIAERLATPSLLNTVLALYRQTADGSRELVARNDRYFGTDSFIELDLAPGVYFVGVTSTGNENYDANVPDSGYGGTTDGPYHLSLSFQADRGGSLRDADGTAMDGNGDGSPGGVHQFWFQASDVDATIFVDRANDPTLGVPDGNGALANPFDTLSVALAAAGSRIVVPKDAAAKLSVGEQFVIDDGTTQVTFTFDLTTSGTTINLAAADLAGEIASVINSSSLSTTAAVNGRVVQLSGLDALDLAASSTLLHTPNLVRIVGNGGLDGDLSTPGDNIPYLLGSDTSGNPLRDGQEFLVPQGVTVMLEAGALVKLRKANLDAGTSSINLSRAASAIQVLGTPELPVWMRSFHDDSFGGNSDGIGPAPRGGDFGGIVFRGDSDMESEGIFLNHVTHVDIRHGGGKVFVDSDEQVFSPIHLVDARPTLRFNYISQSADAAISANPNSFEDSLGRIGPSIVGNFLSENTIDGLFIRIRTELGATLDKLTLPGRFNNTDIPHVLAENLLIAGSPGGPLLTLDGLVARAAGRLVVDPGVVVKLSGARIEAERGASSLIAEGTANRPVIFTSLADDRYGGSGTFDTDANGFSVGQRGHWAGLYFGHVSSGSLDNAIISFGGGDSTIAGDSANFNVIEVHQADLRVTNTLIRDNANGNATDQRQGRGANQAATIYARGAQPVIVGNTILNNAGAAININANSLNHQMLPDYGRSTGPVDRFDQFVDNHGPLVRLNQLSGNTINGMVIRGEVLTTESIWDDTDIVHVLQSTISVGNHHTFSGLRLQSSNSESLVVKLAGTNAGFTATGTPLDIIDRIGGTVHVLGTAGFPVVLTHLADDSVGAGFAPNGTVMSNTNNSPNPTSGASGGWRGFVFDEWSNDRNVAIIRERENPLTSGQDINRTPATAQPLGVLAPNEKSGDENRRLGFEVHGFISPDDTGDIDVYSFRGTAGTPIWIDIDRTDPTLDLIVEVLNTNGTVLARSVRSGELSFPGNLNAATLTQNSMFGGDFYGQNFRDPGLHYVLPGTAGSVGTYFVRVRSNPQTTLITTLAGKSTGKYQLQIRLQQVDEFPGSTVQFADIRFAQTAIDVRGLPSRSPLVGEAGELPADNDTFANAQQLTNLLATDMAALNISGELSSDTDVDWYRFDVSHQLVHPAYGPGTVAMVFDINYADGAAGGPNSTIAVYDSAGRLIYVGRESNIADDRPSGPGSDVDDLSRGSLGTKDPYIGPIHVTPGSTYYVAVMSNRQLPSALTAAYVATPTLSTSALTRLEPVNSVRRVVEDHIGFQGYRTRPLVQGFTSPAVLPETPGIFDISSAQTLENHVIPFSLQDVVLYVATDQVELGTSLGNNDHLYTVNPFSGERYLTRVSPAGGLVSGVNDVQDIVIRSDGRMFGYQRLNNTTNTVGGLVEIDPATGTTTLVSNDNIPGRVPTPNASDLAANLYPAIGNAAQNRLARAEQFTTSDEVDAFTFQRRGTTGPASAPVPIYDTYLVVRETDMDLGSNSKLYRGREDGDATPAIVSNRRYGFLGNIQPAGVTFASTTLRVFGAPATPPAVTPRTDIRIESKIPGNAGNNITINITRPNNTNANVQSVTGNANVGYTINLQIGGTGGPPLTGAPTAEAIVDAINNNAQARRLVTAVIVGGNSNAAGDGDNGTNAISFNGGGSLSGGADGPVGPLAGRVTGLSYGNFLSSGNLFGVTTAGEFLVINPDTGTVLQKIDTANLLGVSNLNFQGLALGPQNVHGGIYANTLFAVTASGQMVALDTNGNGVLAFDSGNSSQLITVNPGSPTTSGSFTLTFDDEGPQSRLTTVPISVNAPATFSLNEQQTVDTVAYGGMFTLSFVKDQGAITSPRELITPAANAFVVQSAVGFPAAPFVIRVGSEEMRVNSRTGTGGTTFNVTRSFNGTTPAGHADTASVFEVVSAPLSGPLAAPVSSPLSATIDNLPSSTTLSVANANSFPATPFTIRVNQEEMRVTNVTNNELTVVRAQNGTAIAAHAMLSPVRVVSASITVGDATPFPTIASPANPFIIRINNEDLRVVDVAGNQFTVIRGANGTNVAAHAGGALVHRVQTTTLLNHNATAVQIRNALANLPFIGGQANVMVTGGSLSGTGSDPVTIEFTGALASRNLRPLTADLSRLVGDEIQQITLDTPINNGSFRLTFNGQPTDPIPYNATAAVVRTALEALPSIVPGDVLVSGGALPGSAINVQFSGTRKNLDVPEMSIDLENNEQQRIAILGAPTDGTFTLAIDDPANNLTGPTAAIAFNAEALDVLNALELAIPALVGNIQVTGGPLPANPLIVEFINNLADTDIEPLTVTSNLTGGADPSVQITVLADGNQTATVTTTRQGQPVSVPVVTQVDGIMSVREALVGLASIGPNDITIGGDLQGAGVNVHFVGQYAGQDVSELEVDNSLMLNNSSAQVAVAGSQGDGLPDSFLMSVTGMNVNGANAVGLAFSPLDFNLWHPTMKRGGANELGHGINQAADGSRAPGNNPVTISSPGPGPNRTTTQAAGGASLHFGFEQWLQTSSTNANSLSYLTYQANVNAQLGIRTTVQHQDLSSNADIVGTYNFPGGALGSLVSGEFSLAGSAREDRPTLYFNYFLETENHGGSNVTSDANDPFRDSARVFASRNGGLTWELVATNNSQLSGPPATGNQRAELPGFLSHLSDAGLNSSTPRAQSHQIVQELMDSTGQWRQARIDLSTFAGAPNVQLRFDFSTAGAMRDSSLIIDPRFGEFQHDTRSIRSTNNFFEGFYIDDIIVGYAERGEMVTGVPVDTSIADLSETGARTQNNDPQFPNNLSGRYQLEVRRVDEYARIARNPTNSAQVGIRIDNTFDTNVRYIAEPGVGTGLLADRNRHRPQGIFIIDSNTIADSSIRGINVQPGTTQAGGSVPHPGSTINFPQLNSDRLVPGVVIQNNIIVGSSGIRFAGETTAEPQRPVPFGRIVNNTLVGSGSGVGVQIDGIASPTVLNNIVTQFTTGIAAAPGATPVIRSNYYQSNAAPGLTGTDPINELEPTTPLFVDAANRNYYLVAGSAAVDSSLNTLGDRFNYVNFKDELGIPPSPIVAPDRDVFGQLRVSSDQGPGGGGSSVFKDRGAVDRADFDAPFAVLLDPIDNDITGIDRDPNLTVVSLPDPIVDAFSILLTDGRGPNAPFEGTGVDPLTVSPDVVTLRRNNRMLLEGVDYTLGYNASTGEMRLTPISTLWEPGGVYEITLDNQVIADRAGNLLRNNQADGSTQFMIILPDVRLDFGDAPDSYGTLLASNGARHALIDGAMPRLGRYVDDEPDGQPPTMLNSTASDDMPSGIIATAALPSGTTVFSVANSGTPEVSIQILSASPVAGDSITIDIGGGVKTFELVPPGVAPQAGNIAIRFVAGDTVESIAEKLRQSILAHLGSPGDALTATIDTDIAPDTIKLVNQDDEDGVGVATLVNGSFPIVFVRPDGSHDSAYPPTIDNNTDVLGFLNPLEPAGSQIAITVMGDGFIDAWIDFNNNGVFDPGSEKVLDSVAVVDGVNIFTIHTPPGTADGDRWMRVRLSPEGGLQPTGLAVGGEVEDYRVEIINVALPVPKDDNYVMFEDGVIDTDIDGLLQVVANDDFAFNTFTPRHVVVVDGPQFAADFNLNPATGDFIYEPLTDFAGIDTFTYYVALQQSAIDTDIAITQAVIATVTIDVRPINDAPLAAPQSFITLESQPTPAAGDPPQVGRGPHPLTITAADLLANARAHENPQYPTPGGPAAPWDETDQSLRVVEIILPDGTVIDASNASDVDGSVIFHTVHGTLVARFVTNDDPLAPFVASLDSFIDLTYISNDYLNRANVDLETVDVLGVNVDIFDFIRFTIEDDGLLIDPATVDPDTLDVIEDETSFADPFNPSDPGNPLGRLRHTSIALIDVAPQNDYPIPANDLISVGEIGAGVLNSAGVINPIDETTTWSQYFITLGLDVPVPTEDEQLIIPAAFLLSNELAGQVISTDENAGPNDGTLSIIDVTMVTAPISGGGGVSVNQDGDVVFQTPKDFYGEIVFIYVVQDSGIDEDIDGTRTVMPLTAIGTVTISVQPVNDAPIGFDRSRSFVESDEPGVDLFEFDANYLLNGSTGETPAVPGTVTPNLVAPFTENEQGLRVVAFTTNQGTVDVADLPDYTGPGTGNGMLELGSDGGGYFEFDVVDGALTNARFFTAPDYNERSPFNPIEELRFTIEDDGRTTDPQTAEVIFLPPVRSLGQATLTITVGQANDAPLFTMLSNFIFDENEGQPVIQTSFVTNVSPGPLTALDELQRQDVTFSFVELNVPAGMMTALPTIDVSGGPGNWPGTGTLTVFPAADAFGFAVYEVIATDTDPTNPRTTTQTLTVTINPINDIPVAFERHLNVIEAVEVDGETALLTFDANRLLTGVAPELPSVEGAFPDTLSDLYNETEQTLRVVAFGVPGAANVDVTVDEPGLVAGTGSVTRTTVTGGTLTFTFQNGAFVSGSYVPAIDYNERTPFDPSDLFTYVISDDGRTTLPGSGFVEFNNSSEDSTIFIPQQRSVAATVTITVTQTNDSPVFNFQPLVNVLERDDNGETVISGWATNIAPAEATALDELARQSVSFSFVSAQSIVPAGLFRIDPVVTPNGTLSVFPARDAVGTAIIVMRATDFEPTAGFVPRSTDATFTVNVQPVNDPPVLNPARFGTSDSLDADTAWAVNAAGTIIYTLREDNTQAGGDTSVDYFIPLRALDSIDVYNQVGLLDVFNVGPANEADDSPGGSQTLSLVNNFPRTTHLGGTLSLAVVDGRLGLQYRPPQDGNLLNRGVDHFTYSVIDNGQTYVLGSSSFVNGSLIDDPLTATGRVELRLNPVNDRPQFVLSSDYVEAAEDTSLVIVNSFATNIAAGPPTATDERSGSTAQSVSFTVNPLSYTQGGADDPFGAGFPRISPTGRLTFQPLPDVFGIFKFEVLLVDSGPGLSDNNRGDLNTSIPVTLTIQIQPVNDPPILIGDPTPLEYEVLEDNFIDLPIDGLEFRPGLLDNYRVGPANEAEDISPLLGGNQTLSLLTPFPTVTNQNGTLTPIMDDQGNVTHLRYTPRAHFVGIDTFSFTVVDDGVTVDLGTGGVGRPDPRTASSGVMINVLPVNDAPIFSGGGNVTSDEDQGVVTIANWATGIQAGPNGADDEISGQISGFPAIAPQAMEFIITQVSSQGSTVFSPLFVTLPFATITGDTATLTYETATDANGVAVFEVRLRDDGPNDPVRGDVNTSPPRTFTITVGAINDPPQFTPGSNITVDEDSGPFSQLWATNILPGPQTAIDELATQTVSFETSFEIIMPPQFTSLFTAGGAPAIDANGVLSFTPADDAAGEASIQLVAIDSEGGRSEPIFFTIFISEVNDPPIAGDITFQGDEDNVLTIRPHDLLAVALDPDLATNPDEVLTITELATVSLAGAVIRVNAAGDFEYDPRGSATLQALAPGEFFLDTFTYRVIDAEAAISNMATVTVNVAGINDAPTVNSNFVLAAPGQMVVIAPLENDFDVDGTIDPSTIFITRQPSSGTLVVRPDGTLLYTPSPSFRGQDLIRYTVADNLGQQSEQTTITIDVNDRPVAVNDSDGTYFEDTLEIDLAQNDSSVASELDLESILIVTPPSNGTITILGGGRVSYQAEDGFVGSDSFQYTISDVDGRTSNIGTVTIQVVGSQLQNPLAFSDVNGDGSVTPFDALLILNRLSLGQRQGFVGGIPVEAIADELPQRFYDVDGNGRVEPLDALLVMNQIVQNNRAQLAGEGESLSSAPAIIAASFSDNPPVVATDFTVIGDAIAEVDGETKFTNFEWVDEDAYSLLATDLVESRREQNRESSDLDLVDAIFADLG